MGVKNKKKSLDGKSSVVKIDSSLLERIEEFIKRDENKLKFVNKKQFIDVLVSDFLEKKRWEKDKK